MKEGSAHISMALCQDMANLPSKVGQRLWKQLDRAVSMSGDETKSSWEVVKGVKKGQELKKREAWTSARPTRAFCFLLAQSSLSFAQPSCLHSLPFLVQPACAQRTACTAIYFLLALMPTAVLSFCGHG